MHRLEGQVAIVTGAGRGIGREYALGLAREGARVVVNDLGGSVEGGGQSRQPADEVVQEIEMLGGKAIASYSDVANYHDAGRTVRDAVDAFGTVDLLITNAGISRRGPLLELAEDGWDEMIGTHLKGTFNFVRHAGPIMVEKRRGTILTVTSGAALIGNLRSVAYASAKGGIIPFTLGLAAELEPFDVTVNSLSPGLTATRLADSGMTDMLQNYGLSEGELRAQWGEPQPASALAPLAVFLASDEARQITGQIFEVAGDRISRVEPARRADHFVHAGGWSVEDLWASFPREFAS